jgi:hypothetical protein
MDVIDWINERIFRYKEFCERSSLYESAVGGLLRWVVGIRVVVEGVLVVMLVVDASKRYFNSFSLKTLNRKLT